MRYYRYGSENAQREVETEEEQRQDVTGRFGELVIEDDTIYEIDEECLQCQKRKNSAGRRQNMII